MDLSEFEFDLPEDLIALRPAEPQDSARLLVVHGDGRLEDATVRDLPAYLSPGDMMVFNDTRVLPAALQGVRPARGPEGRDVEVSLNLVEAAGEGCWQVLARPGRRLHEGDVIALGDGFEARVDEKRDSGEIFIVFNRKGAALEAALERFGAMPLPPYIARRRPADARDRETYQTRFAASEARSVAAPTAGLHFTPRLMDELEAAGIAHDFVRLHVGLGTFSPLTDEQISIGKLHAEWRSIPEPCAVRLNAARGEGARIVPVGTTALRTLESATGADGVIRPVTGPTDIFLKPGDRLNATDALVTNFHLPGSSLFMLVCALMGTGVMRAAYDHAIKARYRFYSYGDACLLLP